MKNLEVVSFWNARGKQNSNISKFKDFWIILINDCLQGLDNSTDIKRFIVWRLFITYYIYYLLLMLFFVFSMFQPIPPNYHGVFPQISFKKGINFILTIFVHQVITPARERGELWWVSMFNNFSSHTIF